MLISTLAWAAAVWWSLSCATLLLTALACLWQPWVKARRATRLDRPPVTVVVPVRLMEVDFWSALRSVLVQRNEDLEVLVAAAENDCEVLPLARQTLDQFPAIPSRIVISCPGVAVSPKMDTLIEPIALAKHDLILVKDAGVELGPGQLAFLIRHLVPGVGLVTAATIAQGCQGAGAYIEAAFLNGYHPRITLAGAVFGLDGALGKVLLFSRGAFERVGGVASVSHTLAEDYALQQAFGRAGLRTVLAGDVVRQTLGRRRFREVWLRQLRWSVIRRVEIPGLFIVEPFFGCAFTTAAAAGAARAVGGKWWLAAGLTVLLWQGAETMMAVGKGWGWTIETVLASIVRELMIPVLWLTAWTTSRVRWAGRELEVRRRA